MTTYSLSLGIAGMMLIFTPHSILEYLTIEINLPSLIFFQIMGGLYFGFAMLNWMVKESRIGGIYNRPVVIANFSHLLITGLALIKALISNPDLPILFWIAAIIYIVFGLIFILFLFLHPAT